MPESARPCQIRARPCQIGLRPWQIGIDHRPPKTASRAYSYVANTFQACTFSATCRQFQFGVSALSLFVSAVPARCVAPMSICRYAHFFASLQTRCSIGAAAFRPRSRAHDAGLSPCARNTMREAISRRHVEQPACRTRCPKEPHAQRSWQLQRSPPVGGSATRSVVAESRSTRDRAAWRSRSS